jgi:hypothetical protein
MEPRTTRVDLPDDVTSPFDVFVNGVPQVRGEDYEQIGRSLFFARELRQEGPLGFWRWTSILLGIAGTYRQDDWVDIAYTVGGQPTVTTRLPIYRVSRDHPSFETFEAMVAPTRSS